MTSHAALVERLSDLSARRPRDPFLTIPWDDPAHAIDPADPRWRLPPDHPLAATGWYRALPPGQQSALGLDLVARFVRVGLEFEAILERGLLRLVEVLPEDAPEVRYAYHEVIEECRHNLMFREFLRRSRRGTTGLEGLVRAIGGHIDRLGSAWPEAFFLFVIGGEEPIDFVERRRLRPEPPAPPLLKKMMQLHVAEEGRHLCFARTFLRARLPGQGRLARAGLAALAPVVLRVMADAMLVPDRRLVAAWSIPAAALREAYGPGSPHERDRVEAVARTRALWAEHGLIPAWAARLWRALGVSP